MYTKTNQSYHITIVIMASHSLPTSSTFHKSAPNHKMKLKQY